MKTTGSNFEEPPVHGRHTDTVCEKLDEKSYLIDGKPINLPLVVELFPGMAFIFPVITPGGKMPKIGDKHPLALDLRSLGLPKKPVFTVTIKNTQMVFGGPEVAAIGEPFIKGH